MDQDKNSWNITKKNIDIMLNDTRHAFGHGYCLAMALLNNRYIYSCYGRYRDKD